MRPRQAWTIGRFWLVTMLAVIAVVIAWTCHVLPPRVRAHVYAERITNAQNVEGNLCALAHMHHPIAQRLLEEFVRAAAPVLKLQTEFLNEPLWHRRKVAPVSTSASGTSMRRT